MPNFVNIYLIFLELKYVDEWIDGWMDGWMDGWVNGWPDGKGT
jgi:hypothetical protein